MQSRLSLRLIVPVGLMVFTLVLAWWSLWVDERMVTVDVEKRAILHLNQDMTRFQAQIEHNLRESALAWIQEQFSQLSTDPRKN